MTVRLFRRHYTKKVEDAFTRRLAELESDIVKKDDALLGEEFQSLIDKDPQLSKIHGELDRKEYEHKYQHAIHSAKIPSYASKHTKDIAFSQPWTGEEKSHDTTLRMVMDKYKPTKSQVEARRLGKAKESVLDFRINKVSDEDSTFRAIYHEKFTPIGSFDKIKTLADARIEEAMRQGQFQNIPRGKKLDVEVKPYIDRTEHHLNNMLVKQNIVPPWIEKQGGVNGEISSFRKEVQDKWESHIRHFYNEDHNAMFVEFKRRWRGILEAKMVNVNSSIRTYNLQAPLSTQKFYLLMDKELERCFTNVNADDVNKQHKLQAERSQREKEQEQSSKSNSFSLKFWKWND